jgi:hypothetical protein
MAGSGRKNADESLIVTLAGGATVQGAAQLCDVSERTIHRRLNDPVFKHRLAQARAGMVERALGHLATGAAEAAVVLRNLLAAEGDNIKLGAARSILELGNKLREGVELEARIAVLENRK